MYDAGYSGDARICIGRPNFSLCGMSVELRVELLKSIQKTQIPTLEGTSLLEEPFLSNTTKHKKKDAFQVSRVRVSQTRHVMGVPHEEMKYSIFLFLCSGFDAMRGVELTT